MRNITKNLILIIISILIISVISTFTKYSLLYKNNNRVLKGYKKEYSIFYYTNPYKVSDESKLYMIRDNINLLKNAKSSKYSAEGINAIYDYLLSQYTLITKLSEIKDGSENEPEYLNKIADEKKTYDKYYDYNKYEKIIKIIKDDKVTTNIKDFNLYNNLTSSQNINSELINTLIASDINILSLENIVKYKNMDNKYLAIQGFANQRLNIFYNITSSVIGEVTENE